MPEDIPFFDVVVIGGGPAGLSAAIRSRWVKGHSALCQTTAIFESGQAGGLVAWRGGFLTGPSNFFRPEDVAQNLLQDCEKLEIPIFEDTVYSICANDQSSEGRWLVRGLNQTVRCDAVICATGLRRQTTESEYFGKGVYLTYMGYGHLKSIFGRIPKTRGTELPIAIVGNRNTVLLDEIFSDVAHESGAEFLFVLEDQGRTQDRLRTKGTVVNEAYRKVEREGEQLVLHTASQSWPVAAVIFDYNAFELTPSMHVEGVDCIDSQGYIATDPQQRTSIPFLYGAGDITGGYAMILEAMAQGARAGFAAYRDLYRDRFDQDPSLFAYTPDEVAITREYRVLPVWHPEDEIQVLSTERQPRQHADDPDVDRMHFRFADLQAQCGNSRACELLDFWVEKKWATVRRKKS